MAHKTNLYIIRYKNVNSDWQYEICTEEDLEHYQDARDAYEMIIDPLLRKELLGIKLEEVSNNVDISSEALHYLQRLEEPELT